MQYRKYRMAEIANGVFVPSRVSESLIDEYLQKQAECPHQKRDPRGTCYACGHKNDDPFKGFGRSLTCA